MRIIVTGASGFVGRNFLLQLPPKDKAVAVYHRSSGFPKFVKNQKLKNITAFFCDLTNSRQVGSLAKKVGGYFDTCVYLAANGNPALSVQDPLFDLRSNTFALINFLEHFRIKRLIFFSSGAVYDGCRGIVAPQSPLSPALPYAVSKLAAEQYVRFSHNEGKITEYVIVRFFGAYGPYEPSRKIYSKLIDTFFVRGKNSFTVRGNGKNFIDAMYIDDAVSGIFKMIHSSRKNLTVNFTRSQPITINGLVKTAGRVFDVKRLHITHQGTVPEYNRFHASAGEMQKAFDFTPGISLEEGLIRFAGFINNTHKFK